MLTKVDKNLGGGGGWDWAKVDANFSKKYNLQRKTFIESFIYSVIFGFIYSVP